jgi:hypothetical protein
MRRHAIFRNYADSWNVQAASGMPEAFPFGRSQLLAAADPVAAFDCGVEALNSPLLIAHVAANSECPPDFTLL